MSTKSQTKKQSQESGEKQSQRVKADRDGMPPRKRQTPETPPAPSTPDEIPTPPDDSQELVVFAFRLSRAERDLIHAAAGSAKASKFVRTLAVAAAQGDGPAVLGILDTLQTK